MSGSVPDGMTCAVAEKKAPEPAFAGRELFCTDGIGKRQSKNAPVPGIFTYRFSLAFTYTGSPGSDFIRHIPDMLKISGTGAFFNWRFQQLYHLGENCTKQSVG